MGWEREEEAPRRAALRLRPALSYAGSGASDWSLSVVMHPRNDLDRLYGLTSQRQSSEAHTTRVTAEVGTAILSLRNSSFKFGLDMPPERGYVCAL
jgi:hypothetical protein